MVSDDYGGMLYYTEVDVKNGLLRRRVSEGELCRKSEVWPISPGGLIT